MIKVRFQIFFSTFIVSATCSQDPPQEYISLINLLSSVKKFLSIRGKKVLAVFIGENKQKGYEGGKLFLPSQHSKTLILL